MRYSRSVGRYEVETYTDWRSLLIGINWWGDHGAVYVHLGPFHVGVYTR